MLRRDHLLELEARQQIYNYILKNPGVHLREISRNLSIPLTTLNYHIIFLKKNGLIIEEANNNHSSFFIRNIYGRRGKKFFTLFRQRIPQQIILLFFVNPIMSRQDISKELEIHPNTTDYHLKKLLKLDVIEEVEQCDEGIVVQPRINIGQPLILNRKKVTNEVIYRLKESEIFYPLYRIYQKDIINSKVSKDIVDFINIIKNDRKNQSKKIIGTDTSIKKLEGLFFDLFPCPFCA